MNLSWLLPEQKGIPVLMYHKVWPGASNDLTITPGQLREHWRYLENEGYKALSLQEYVEITVGKKGLPEKAILITFDDGYVNNFTYVYPLLQELKWQATFFIIGGLLDGTYGAGEGSDEKMQLRQLLQLNPEVVQLAMHGYHHLNMKDISLAETIEEVQRASEVFRQSGLKYHKVWAYAYGARPKGRDMDTLQQTMAESGITAAFRIGNRLTRIPASHLFELPRIDIKGTDTIEELKIKLIKGKLKPF